MSLYFSFLKMGSNTSGRNLSQTGQVVLVWIKTTLLCWWIIFLAFFSVTTLNVIDCLLNSCFVKAQSGHFTQKLLIRIRTVLEHLDGLIDFTIPEFSYGCNHFTFLHIWQHFGHLHSDVRAILSRKCLLSWRILCGLWFRYMLFQHIDERANS